MILPNFISALQKELKYYLLENGLTGTVVLDTQLKGDIAPEFPLFLIEISQASDSARLIGGLTRVCWDFALQIHFYEPNAYGSEDSDYAASLAEIVDKVRVHFENEVWKVQEMQGLQTDYGLRITYQGTGAAAGIEVDEGMFTMAYRHEFVSVAFDQDTTPTYAYPADNNPATGTISFKSYS